MKWTEVATEDLREYTGLRASVRNISERIEALELEFTGIKGSQTDRMPVSGSGGNKWEDFLVNNIVERDQLKLKLMSVQKYVKIISRGLSALTDEESLVLKYFYISKEENHIEKLIEQLGIERSEVYRLKERALRKFTLYMYGLQDY